MEGLIQVDFRLFDWIDWFVIESERNWTLKHDHLKKLMIT